MGHGMNDRHELDTIDRVPTGKTTFDTHVIPGLTGNGTRHSAFDMMNRFIALSFLFAATATAQHTHEARLIEFPDIPGYQTLKCDFHIHTVFSDGSVWPNIRVQEAIRDGLDAISLTEHLEYQPHADDIPHPDRNRSYQIALEEAADNDLIIVHGSEITRDMPPGHTNAIFIEDANKLLLDDPVEVFREVQRQGGFAFWNHPNWTAHRPDGVARLTDMHRMLIDEGLLQGIEVVNDVTYSDEALEIALENDLVIVGTSDIHGLVDWSYEVPQGGHRPLMLVFATERSEAGIEEAMRAGRTAAYFKSRLIGKEEYLKPLLQASIRTQTAAYPDEEDPVLRVVLVNVSDADYVLANTSEYTFHGNTDVILLNAHDTVTLDVKTLEHVESITLAFDVLSAVTAPNTHPRIQIHVPVE